MLGRTAHAYYLLEKGHSQSTQPREDGTCLGGSVKPLLFQLSRRSDHRRSGCLFLDPHMAHQASGADVAYIPPDFSPPPVFPERQGRAVERARRCRRCEQRTTETAQSGRPRRLGGVGDESPGPAFQVCFPTWMRTLEQIGRPKRSVDDHVSHVGLLATRPLQLNAI